MATIDYQQVAGGGGANVDSQAAFLASSYLPTGFVAGVAASSSANKCWRQATMAMAMLAPWISVENGNVDVLDDGNVSALTALFAAAVAAAAKAAVPIVTTRNGNGTFIKSPDGAGGFLYEAYGTVTSGAVGGGTLATQAITFPATFPGNPVLTLSLGTYPDGTNEDAVTVYHLGTSTTGATAVIRAATNIGGSGAGSLNAIPIHWRATY